MSLPIIVVMAAIGYLYYATVFVVIDGWLGLRTATGLANAAVFTAVAAVAVATYGVAVVRDPGTVPSSFVPDIEDTSSPVHEIKRKVLFAGRSVPRFGIIGVVYWNWDVWLDGRSV